MPWSQTQVYNTIMAVAVGVSLFLLVSFLAKLQDGSLKKIEGWIMGFIVPGFILLITGAHMILTWPISKLGLPFDDIIFGEPSFAFGMMLVVFSFFLMHRYKLSIAKNLNESELFENLKQDLPEILKPLSLFIAAMGLSCIMITIAGITYKLFAAPPQEPISGMFADFPLIEATFVSSLYALVGIGAITFAFWLRNTQNLALFKIFSKCWQISGIIFALFGIMNYFTHIGLIVNTL